MIEFSIPALGQGTGQALAISAASAVVPNPIVPAAPAGTLVPQIGKAMVAITGIGATQQQFANVYYCVGQNPVATGTCPALIAGNVYLIEGFTPGDKIAFLSPSGAGTAVVTRVA